MLQAIQHKVADMATEFYAARSMTYTALAALDEGREVAAEAFMCKLFVAESTFRILTGTSEIQRNGIAKLLAFDH